MCPLWAAGFKRGVCASQGLIHMYRTEGITSMFKGAPWHSVPLVGNVVHGAWGGWFLCVTRVVMPRAHTPNITTDVAGIASLPEQGQ